MTNQLVGRLLKKALSVNPRIAKLMENPLVYTKQEKHPEFRFTTEFSRQY